MLKLTALIITSSIVEQLTNTVPDGNDQQLRQDWVRETDFG